MADLDQLVDSLWPEIQEAVRVGQLTPLFRTFQGELGDDHPLTQLVAADLAARLAVGSMVDVQRLAATEPIATSAALSAWCTAILAETGLWQGQLWGYVVGTAALTSMPDSDRPLVRYSIARVQRIASFVELVTRSTTADPVEPLIERTTRPFSELGLDEEVATTIGLFAAFHAMGEIGEARRYWLSRFRQAIGEAIDSDRARLGLLALAWIEAVNRDLPQAEQALREARQAPNRLPDVFGDTSDVAFGPLERLISTVVDLQIEGATDLTRERVISYLDTYTGFLVPTTYAALVIAHLLIDAAAPDAAIEALSYVDQTELSFNAFSHAYFTVLWHLASLAIENFADTNRMPSEEDDSASTVFEVCRSWFGTHQEPLARHIFLVVAKAASDDHHRVTASELVWDGIDPAGELARWLARFEEVIERAWSAPRRVPVHEGTLRTLGPDVEVLIGTTTSHGLTRKTADLLAVLVARRGRAPTEWVAHLVAGNSESPKTALRSTLYRARRELAPFEGIDIRREEDDLVLELSDRWVVDAWQVEKHLRHARVADLTVPLFSIQTDLNVIDDYRRELLRAWAHVHRDTPQSDLEQALARAAQLSPYWADEARWLLTVERPH